MNAYYNENDPFAADWLEALIADGQLPRGFVDQRDIHEVAARDLEGFSQCHFFAGIGGWPVALRLAGWPDDAPVWTGSCPCQPFSAAGKRKGVADARHLWPEFRRLIGEREPSVVFGEQVASKDGREWLAGVRADLEALDYAVGAADLCAAGSGAPHIRQRLFWVGDSLSTRWSEGWSIARDRSTASGGAVGGMADANGGFSGNGELQSCREHRQFTQDGRAGERAGNSDDEGPQGRSQHVGEYADQWTPWASGVFIECLDGTARRVEPSIFPLAHGVPNRVGTLRGAGNAIVPQIAAEFIAAYRADAPLFAEVSG